MNIDNEPTTAGPTPWWELSGMEREIAKYDQCEEPGNCDHDHDNAIDYFREQELNGLRAQRDDARALAILCRQAIDQMPIMLSEFIGVDYEELPGWFVGYDNGREMWGGGDA